MVVYDATVVMVTSAVFMLSTVATPVVKAVRAVALNAAGVTPARPTFALTFFVATAVAMGGEGDGGGGDGGAGGSGGDGGGGGAGGGDGTVHHAKPGVVPSA